MPLNNYSNLKAAIVSWSKRNDVANYVDDFIDLCESEMYKYLRIRDMQTRQTNNLSARFLALPDDFIEMRRLRLETGGRNVQLTSVVPEALKITSGSGIPTSYTVTTQLEFDRTPDSTYTIEMQLWSKLTALDDTNTTNAVLTRFPEIYLQGSLWALFDWAREPELSSYYYERFINAIKQANDMDLKGRVGPTPAMRTDGPTP